MQGFKSFADPVTIELNDGITCIVGPNGSGKSNISDAVRWVLGEQNPRSLRGGRMEDVIFSGTATRKPKGMAEVTLVVDNSSGMLPLDYSEVAITRRMYRSGESEFLINGNRCRLRDIKELFMDTGIGVDGYSIIGQGRIADIVSTKPENRREIFEEAAGVVMYKTRKAEAERKLASASDNLERVRDIINEIESRIGGLKTESEKASEYIVLRDRYKYLSVNIILHNLVSLEKSVKAAEEELAELNEQYESRVAKAEELEQILESQRLRDADLSGKAEQANRDLLAKVEELHLITNRGQINEERLASIERELTRLGDVIRDAEKKVSLEQENYDSLHANELALAADKATAEQDLQQAIYRLNEHQTKASIVNEEVERNKNEIIDLSNKNVARRAEISTLENYKVTLNARRDQLVADFETRDEAETANREALRVAEAALEEKEQKNRALTKRTEEIANNIISVNNKSADLSDEIERTTIEINRATARRSTIEEMEANYEGYNNAVRQVMQRSFRGIIGTVSDLIQVPEQYILAVETALGAQLQNIVCEDDDAARSAIDWLKAAKAGRATFLPVRSVKADPIPLSGRVKDAEGFIGLGSDLVTSDKRYEKIVQYLLCRVILVDRMDHAVRISKLPIGGFRIVTLEGEVITASGSITGGTYKNKTANLLDRKNEIQTLTARIDGLKAQLERAKGKKEQCERDIRALKDERSAVYQELQQIEVDCSALRSDRDHALELVKAAADSQERYQAEIETVKDDISRAEAMVSRYQAEIEASEAEIAELQETAEQHIADAQKYRSIVEDDNEEIVRCRVSLSEIETKVLGLNELIERVRDSLTEAEIILEESKDEEKELTDQRTLLTSTGEEAGEKVEQLRVEKEALEESLQALQANLDRNRAAHETSLREQKSNANELSALQDKKYKLEVRSARNEALLDAQKDKLWEEFEISYAEALDMRDDSFTITSGNKEAREVRLRMAELGDVNISSIEEYKTVSKRYEFMTAQEADITRAMNELKGIISNMDRTIREKFKENFDKVVVNFEESFKELFGGGTAELRLEDESDPLESGIEIIAQPPGKRLKNINLMSGGEKTLTAIALMFAVLKAKPTPFCILDEVEAALDEANIERFSNYLHNFKEVQFALITHQKATMEHADVLYGVTMPEQGITRLLSLRLGDAFDVDGLS